MSVQLDKTSLWKRGSNYIMNSQWDEWSRNRQKTIRFTIWSYTSTSILRRARASQPRRRPSAHDPTRHFNYCRHRPPILHNSQTKLPPSHSGSPCGTPRWQLAPTLSILRSQCRPSFNKSRGLRYQGWLQRELTIAPTRRGARTLVSHCRAGRAPRRRRWVALTFLLTKRRRGENEGERRSKRVCAYKSDRKLEEY